ncbi:MAG: MBL fold metallo-hydrolase [Vicinamibacterales bacterium]
MLLRAFNPSPWTGPTGNNTYLLDGAIPTLIDAGVGHQDHLAAIAEVLGDRRLAQVLITHGHLDHVSGVPALAARWPGLRVKSLDAGTRSGDDLLSDGQYVHAGDTVVRVLATPGHAPDHACFVSGDDVYSGDLIRTGGTIVIAASRGGDLRAYLDSLRRVRALSATRLLPGHGPTIDDPDDAIGRYLAHREGRERQVLEALRDGHHTAEAVALHIYRGLDPALASAATDTILAHLIKLAQDGTVTRTGDGWERA